MNQEIKDRSKPVPLNNINGHTLEGQMLEAALVIITTDAYPNQTPEEALGYIVELRHEMRKNSARKEKGLNFSQALDWMKDGQKVCRAGWNGQDMYAFIQQGYSDGIAINKNTAEASGIPEGTVCKFRPYFMLWTAQKDFAHWVPSGSDILADDWEITNPSEHH